MVGESEAVLMVSRPSKDKTFDKHWFIAPPQDPRELRNALRRFGFQESSVIADFVTAFGGLREELPGVSGYFPAIQHWERFDSPWMRAMWDQPLTSKLAAWQGAVIFYVSLNGDVLLLRRDQALAWWDHEMNAVRPLRKTFRGFLQYYGKYIQSDFPFSSCAPPSEEEILRDTKTSKGLNKVWMKLMKALK
jgi:hypothetical protein